MTTTVLPSAGTSAAAGPGRPRTRDRLVSLQRRIPVVQIILLVVVFCFGLATLPGFGNATSIKSILILSALVGIAALGQTVVVLIGGIDLSVAGFIVAGAIMVTQLTSVNKMPFALALLIAFVGAALLGGIVGYLCHRFSVHPIIVTFAMGSIALGLAQLQTGGTFGGGAPAWLSQMTSPITLTLGLPVPPLVAVWVVVIILVALFLHKTVAGRRLMATGASPRAAQLVHISTRRVWVLVFAFSAVASVFAGVFLAGFAGNVDSTLGNPYLFQSIAAVIIGGTIFGGPGDYTRTVVGVLLLTVLTTVLVGQGFTGADQQILYGLVILVAMAVYGRERRLRDQV
ncbi:ABC transporter permease [Arthrobacter sp. CAL618]|uniref:ABC transporter permease n=1 Tax=Arthrobacter sp. CAL618 TaxID=1055770 RepID=UPI0004646EF2|nr:ABC transporter permease [Arthrobacter sp. CAL618]